MPTVANFPGVLGHHTTQERLSRAIARDQLHHGMIFVGPSGVGKATLARGLGCALVCDRQPAVGCGSCNACRRVLGGTHVGVEWIEPEQPGGLIKVATARELANQLELAPYEGNTHLVVFDPADALTEQAYNALLKTLEEPRPGVHFVMIATNLSRLLPTILSRCLVVRFGRLDEPTVRDIVHQALEHSSDAKDAAPPSTERIDLAVRLSEGSAGLATTLATDPSLDDALALLQHAITAAAKGPKGIFAGDKSPLWAAWNEAIGPTRAGRPARERAAAARLAQLWLLHLRETLRGRPGLPGVKVRPASVSETIAQLNRVQTFVEGLERNPNVRLALEQTLLEL